MVELGDKGKDIITGFEGICIAKFFWINGCVRADLQPQQMHEGKLVKSESFDVQQIEVTEKGCVKLKGVSYREQPKKVGTGGPMPTPKEY